MDVLELFYFPKLGITSCNSLCFRRLVFPDFSFFLIFFMANKDSKGPMITSSLEFEGIEHMDLSDLNLPPAPAPEPEPVPPPEPPAASPPPKARRAPPPAPTEVKEGPKIEKVVIPPKVDKTTVRRKAPPIAEPNRILPTTEVKEEKQIIDHFSEYAAMIALAIFVLIPMGIYWYMQTSSKNAAEVSYLKLPEALVNIDGHVMRVTISVQVDMNDETWLIDNKERLGDLFKTVLTRSNISDLRSIKDYSSLQNDIKEELNREMHTEKSKMYSSLSYSHKINRDDRCRRLIKADVNFIF